jgi:hypothetical protein
MVSGESGPDIEKEILDADNDFDSEFFKKIALSGSFASLIRLNFATRKLPLASMSLGKGSLADEEFTVV